MADANLNIKITTKAEDATKKFQELGRDIKGLGRDLSQVSRELVVFSGAITGGFTAAFAFARKDLPQVNTQFLQLQNSLQSMADAVATATIPSFNEFNKIMASLAVTIRDFAESHGELLNQILKYSAMTLAITTLGFAFSKLIKFVGEIVILFGKFLTLFGIAQPYIVAITGAVLTLAFAFQMLSDKTISFMDKLKALSMGPIGLGSLFGKSKMGKDLDDMKKALDEFFKNFNANMGKIPERSIDAFGKFSEGFRDAIATMNEALAQFGAGVSAAIDKAFGDTIFNTITGRVTSLKSLVTSLGDDMARAFSRFASNQIMGALFGDKEGSRSGLFGGLGLGKIFGNSGGSTSSVSADASIKKTASTFDALTDNMKKFAKAKDDVIDNLKKFGHQIDGTGKKLGGGVGGAMAAGGAGAGASLGIEIAGMDNVSKLNELLSQTFGLGTMIQGVFDAMPGSFIKMGAVYAAVQAAMLGVSVASAAITTAVMTSMASALAAAWVVPAVLASIATLGAAAAIGAGALAAAVGGSVGGMLGLQGALVAGGSGAGGAGELPKGAGITFGSGSGVEGIPRYGVGGIVDRPTLAIIGEEGPEAVVPLSGKRSGGNLPMGNRNVKISIDTAILNNPSNMQQFVKMLSEELSRGAL